MTKRWYAGAAALLVFAAIFLHSVLHSGHAADDMFAANIRGFVEYYHLTIWQFIGMYNDRIEAQLGRLFPGAVIIQSLTYYLSPEPFPVKVAQEVIILINLATFGWFVVKLTGSRALAAITVLVAVAAYQFRYFYDPIISFVITLPVMFELSLLAAIALLWYAERGGIWRLIVSYALFALACLTYEVAYPYFLIYGVVAFFAIQRRRKAATITAGYLAIVAALVVVDFALRSGIDFDNPAKHSEYALSHDVMATLATFWWQFINAVPNSYRYFDPQAIFENNAIIWHATGRLSTWALGVAGAALLAISAWGIRGIDRAQSRIRPYVFLAIGLLFWSLPATLISLSPRWHAEVGPGNAYLPIYFETYGAAFTIAVLLVGAFRYLRRFGPLPRGIAIALLCVAFAFSIRQTYRANSLVVEIYNEQWKYPRTALSNAFAGHIFDRTPEGTTILPTGPYPFIGADGWFWDTRYMIYLYAHKRVVVIPTRFIPSFVRSTCAKKDARCAQSGNKTASLTFGATADDAYVVVANNARLNPAYGSGVAASALIWERNPAFAASPPTAPLMVDATLANAGDFHRLQSNRDTALFDYTPACPFDPGFFAHRNVVWYELGSDFYGYEYLAASRWNWAHQHASLTLHNSSTATRVANFAFTIVIPSPGTHHFVISWPGHVRRLTMLNAPVPVTLPVTLRPFESAVVTLTTDAGVVPKPPSDPRDLHFQLVNDFAVVAARRRALVARLFAVMKLFKPREAPFPLRPPLPLPAGETEQSLFAFVTSVRVADAPEEEMKAYGTHDFRRFVYTWNLASATSGRLLELGANPYFTTMLLKAFGDRELVLANFFSDGMPATGSQTVTFQRNGTSETTVFTFDHFNIESDRFPYDDGAFSVVIFAEIIEHLLNDPLSVLAEIRRVLTPGGQLILTTPNVSRLENVARSISGANIYDPYSGYGPYGRHNREYNRHELDLLLRFAGFRPEIMFTADVHENAAAEFAKLKDLEPLLRFRENDLGQYIFVRAVADLPVQSGRPDFLFRSYPPGVCVPWPPKK